MTVTPALNELITKRLASLERVLNDAAISAAVIVTKEKYRHKVEMAIHTRGDHTLSGTAEANTWALATRQAGAKIEQQAKKLKGKWADRKRQSAKLARAERTSSEGDTAAVTALLDRLLHYAHVLKCGPRSWRTKVQTDLRTEEGTK